VRYLIVALSLCVAVGIVLSGCQKAPTDTNGPAVVKGSARPVAPPKVDDKATAQTKTLTDPDGKKLTLVAPGDTAFLKAAGIPEYPGSTAYNLDLAQAMKDSGESVSKEDAEMSKLLKTVVLETSDSIDKIETWAKENLKDWTIKPMETKGTEKTFEASKELALNLMVFEYPSDKKCYIMIMDATDVMKQMESALAAAAAGMGDAAKDLTKEAMKETGKETPKPAAPKKGN
jgi:hypothetical protein